jgi:hypothetical protein
MESTNDNNKLRVYYQVYEVILPDAEKYSREQAVEIMTSVGMKRYGLT